MSNPVIRVRNLRKSFGEVIAVDGVDITVDHGEVLCIIGASGSGKSTALRCMNMLEVPDSGEIIFHDRDITKLKPRGLMDVRRRLGMVFQHYNLFPHRTALENVVEGLRYGKGMEPEQAELRGYTYLKKVGLEGRENSFPSELSGGQQQRVAIARALAMDPEALLFDEPTSALDPELVGEVLKVMADLARQGTTMVVVTHEIEFAKAVGDRVCYFDKGRIVESGPAAQVLEEPKEFRTQRFLKRLLSTGAQSSPPPGLN